MGYSPGNIFYQQLTTFNVSGISTNTDVTPWGTMVRNGADDVVPHIFTGNVDIGRYNVSGTIPSTYRLGDSVGIITSGLVGGSLSKSYISLGVMDNQVSNLTSIAVTGSAPQNFLGLNSVIPGVTVSVTGVVSTVNLVNTTTSLTNPVSVTGTLPLAQLSSVGLDLVLIETGVTAKQALTEMSAVLAGVSSGTGNTIWYQGINNANQNRVSSNAISGIRSSVTLTLP